MGKHPREIVWAGAGAVLYYYAVGTAHSRQGRGCGRFVGSGDYFWRTVGLEERGSNSSPEKKLWTL